MQPVASTRRGRYFALLLAIMSIALAVSTSCVATSSPDVPTPKPSPYAPEEGSVVLAISSPAFEAGGLIPAEYANNGYPGGENTSIPYEWAGAPEGTKSWALLLIDRHPDANSWVHWLVTSIPPAVVSLARGTSGSGMPAGAKAHANSFGTLGYGGPQPPTGTGKHEYEAVLYALDTDVNLPERISLNEFVRAIDGHVLATAACSGMLGR